MLRGLIICPNAEMAEQLEMALVATNGVTVVSRLQRYPNGIELTRLLRATGPQVVFLSAESPSKAVEAAKTIERATQGIQIIGVDHAYEPQVLLDVMRAGLREFVTLPFELQPLSEALSRVEELVLKDVLTTGSTGRVFSFLPSKPGVGTSTVALNAARALASLSENGTLLLDFDLTSGILGFMLKLSGVHSVADALENAQDLDETNWRQLVCRVARMEILPSGHVNPEFRVEGAQIHHLLEFARRHYTAICVDLSGNLESHSIEVMHESKQIFLVCTPEVPSLHLAGEKLEFLNRAGLVDRAVLLLNRAHKHSLIADSEIESLLGIPITMKFSNDYLGVHRSLQLGRPVAASTELGKQFINLGGYILSDRGQQDHGNKKGRGIVEQFSMLLEPERAGASAP